jgi:hypothetical protein
MYSLNAAGIAAIQVGRLERIFIIDGKVADPDAGDDAKALVFINPELVETGKGLTIVEEGCLSFPNVFIDVKRPRWAKIRAMDVEGDLRGRRRGAVRAGPAARARPPHRPADDRPRRHGQEGGHQAQDEALAQRARRQAAAAEAQRAGSRQVARGAPSRRGLR